MWWLLGVCVVGLIYPATMVDMNGLKGR